MAASSTPPSNCTGYLGITPLATPTVPSFVKCIRPLANVPIWTFIACSDFYPVCQDSICNVDSDCLGGYHCRQDPFFPALFTMSCVTTVLVSTTISPSNQCNVDANNYQTNNSFSCINTQARLLDAGSFVSNPIVVYQSCAAPRNNCSGPSYTEMTTCRLVCDTLSCTADKDCLSCGVGSGCTTMYHCLPLYLNSTGSANGCIAQMTPLSFKSSLHKRTPQDDGGDDDNDTGWWDDEGATFNN